MKAVNIMEVKVINELDEVDSGKLEKAIDVKMIHGLGEPERVELGKALMAMYFYMAKYWKHRPAINGSFAVNVWHLLGPYLDCRAIPAEHDGFPVGDMKELDFYMRNVGEKCDAYRGAFSVFGEEFTRSIWIQRITGPQEFGGGKWYIRVEISLLCEEPLGPMFPFTKFHKIPVDALDAEALYREVYVQAPAPAAVELHPLDAFY